MENIIIPEKEVHQKTQSDWNGQIENDNYNCSDSHEACSETRLFVGNNDDPPPYETLTTNDLPWSHVVSSNVQCCDSNRNHFEPLTLYTMLRLNTCPLIRSSSISLYSEDSTKVNVVNVRKYGVICIGCVVVISLMVLSLLVRCLIEKSFWQN